MGRKRKCSVDDENCIDGKPPVQRNAANERERDRMRVLSKAFSKLKTTLPWVPPDTKLSKLDTLRLATCYIGHLRQVLSEDEGDSCSISLPEHTHHTSNSNSSTSPNVHPLNLTWPYSFSARLPTDMTSSIPCATANQLSDHS